MFYFDPLYYVLILPSLALALYAQSKVKGTYARYLRVQARSGYTGAKVARELLCRNGVDGVEVEASRGELSDHYDPRSRKIRLSHAVYEGTSLSALGIAAHETGHALQHHEEYVPLHMRSLIVPVAGFGSNLAFPLFFIGIIASVEFLQTLGILLFTAAVVFTVITLPVEYNASGRALTLLADGGFLGREEVDGVRRVLGAAALTYLAATAMALSQLLYLLVMRSRRD